MAKSMFENLNAIVANTLTDSIKMLDIDELHESEDNFFIVNRVEELADTILGQGGVKDNLIVRPLETGGYEIISGHRRRAAVQHLLDRGENVSRYLPCLVQDYSDEDNKVLDIILMNISARRISDSELWKSYEIVDKILKNQKSAGEKFGRIREKLAELLGVSAAQVGKMQNVEKNAIDEVKEAVKNGDLTISTANEIAKLDEETQKKLADSDLSKVQHKDVKEMKPIKWDGIIYADIIKKRLLSFLRSAELESAQTMNNSDFSDMIRKNHRHHSTTNDGVSVTGSFDKITVRFLKKTDISEVYMSWTMAARHIRTWVQEDMAAASDEKKKVDTYSTISDSSYADKAEPEKIDTYINTSEDSPKADTSSTIPESSSVDTVKAEEVDTYIKKSANIPKADTSNTVPESKSDDEVKSEKVDTYSTNSELSNEKPLEKFIHDHYYDLESIFTSYISLAAEDEIKIIEEFQKLLRQTKEAERKKVRFGL